jgi:hypothetical protein
MLLVFGVRYLAAVVADGVFHCPSCGGDRPYRLRRPRAWIHVFWLPVVPLRDGAEYAECDACRTRHEPAVLDVPTSARLAELLSRGMRTAAAYALTGLAGPAGADVSVAAGMLQTSLGPDYTPELLAADLAAHREGSDFTVLGQLAAQLTLLGRESLLRGLADLVLAIDGSGEPDWLRIGHVAAALGVPAARAARIVEEACSRARE